MAQARGRTTGRASAAQRDNEDDAEAAVTAEVERAAERAFQGFPSGSKALDDKDDADPVTLINLHLSRHRISLPHTFKKTKAGYAMERAEVLPFGVLHPEWAKSKNVKPVTVADARRVLETQETKLVRIGAITRPRPPKIVVAPPHGNCRGAMHFTAFGRRWETCTYGGCTHHDGGRYPWSVAQMQILIGRLETAPAIRAIIERVDTRAAVVLWGQHVIHERAEAKRKRMGFGSTAVAAAVN